MQSDYEDLDLGLQDLKWPTPPDDPTSDQPPAGDEVSAPRDPVPDLLEQEIAAGRVNGTPVPVQIVQQYAMPPALPPQPAVPTLVAQQTPQVEAPPQPIKLMVRAIERRLFVCLQTIPDYERVAKLRMPELPATPETCEFDDLPNPSDLVKSKMKYQTILELIRKQNPPREWLEAIVFAEEQIIDGRKRRQRVIEECEERIHAFDTVQNAIAERIVTLSGIPEFAQIAGIAFACGDGPVHSLAVGQPTRGGGPISERAILALFWSTVPAVAKVVCWGDCRHLLFTRSCLAGIEPRTIRPIDVEDLSTFVVGDRNMGPHTLEDVCQVYGLEPPIDPLPNQLVVADAVSQQNYTGVQSSSLTRLEMLRRLWMKWEGFHVARG